MAEHPGQQLNQWSLWATVNPSDCPCRGTGWLLSDFDTWHECGLHRHGAPHPEDEDAVHDPERKLRVYRQAYRTFLDHSGLGPKDFRRKCVEWLGREPRTPEEWVDAADAVAAESAYHQEEAEARKNFHESLLTSCHSSLR